MPHTPPEIKEVAVPAAGETVAAPVAKAPEAATPVKRTARKKAAVKAATPKVGAAADWPHPAATAPVKKAAEKTSEKPVKAAPRKRVVPAVTVGVDAGVEVAVKKAVKPARPTPVVAAKPVKAKLLHHSFTIPANEYAALAALKQRALATARPVKKSELLRAGIKLLVALSDAALLKALKDVPSIKTGRPRSKKGG